MMPSNITEEKSTIQLPKKHHDYVDGFDKVKSNTPPQHRPYDCPIDLQPGKEPPWGPIYNLSLTELEVLRAYIEKKLANGFIQLSRSPIGTTIFVVKKKDASHCLHVDCKGLNKVTMRIRYALPLISSPLESINGAKYFTKIDLRCVYNLFIFKLEMSRRPLFAQNTVILSILSCLLVLRTHKIVFQHREYDIFLYFLNIFLFTIF